MKIRSRLAAYTSFVLVVVLLASYKLCSSDTPIKGKNELLLRVLVQGLNTGHYQPPRIDDSFSRKVFDLYLQRLDYNKKFLLQEDVDALKKYQDQIDDQIQAGSFEFFNLSDQIFQKRLKESEEYYKEILHKPFDYNQNETIQLNGEKLAFAKTKPELKEEWRKYLKYQTMIRLSDALEAQESPSADNSKEKKETKSMKELEEEARKKVEDTYDDLYSRLGKVETSDRMSLYLNAIANAYDPHTEFYPPKDKEDFDIEFTGRLEGIGASLQEKDGQIKVQAIIPGSPSYRQGELKAGDVILKVAQGKDEPVDVVGMRLDNAVRLIRGKKGTEVRLTVRKIDGSTKIIPIIRDVVIFEETFAKSAIVDEKQKIGYIKLPGFYADFERKGGRNSGADVKQEIEKLKKEG
ncbi:MAG: PDZ domain-containing protein, partial [Hymenobacteraceae bacterium]|nr:PDZ domain-containing protein [Hymenobacteraceae bacterium]